MTLLVAVLTPNSCHRKRILPYIATNPFAIEFTHFLWSPQGRGKIEFPHPLVQSPLQTKKTSLNQLTSFFSPAEGLNSVAFWF